MEEVDPQPGLRANSPRLIKYDALILRKKRERERETEERVWGKKKGPIATYMQICILKHRYHLHSDASL